MSRVVNQSGINSNAQTQAMTMADGPALDAFGRQRISQPFGLFDNKFLSSKNQFLWDEALAGCVMVHGTVTGSFQVGQTFTGATSGLTGVITQIINATSFYYTTKDNDFTASETITTATGSATITTNDTGSDVVFQYYRASVALNVGTVAGQKVTRQTFRYFPYVSGYSQLVNTTQVFNSFKAGLRQTVMYGDELNGIGIMVDGLEVKVFIRTNTSGTPVTNAVAQADWNIDKLNGFGAEHGNPSGLTLDISKNQIQSIDFQWLGIGRVRMNLNIDGASIQIHEFDHANVTSGVYMRTPSLPIRYEIENITNTASPSSLEQICCAVASEGGYMVPGLEFSVTNGIVERTLSDTASTPILAVRLKNAAENGGLPVRKTIKLVNIGGFARASDVLLELFHVHGVKTFTGNWVDVDDTSFARFSTDVSALTALHQHRVETSIVPTGGSTQASGYDTIDTSIINNHVYLNQNMESDNSDLFVLYARSRSGVAYALGHISFVELE